MSNTLSAVSLLLDSNRGVYIPQNFCTNFDLTKWNNIRQHCIDIILSKDEHDNLQSPYEIEGYWDAWQEILDSATFVENGNTWYLSQDGDLWAMCYELMTNEERLNFGMDALPTHEYYINLDERGEFYADVRDMQGNTVFEWHGFDMFGNEMKDKNDIEGLQQYLIDDCIIPADSVLIKGN